MSYVYEIFLRHGQVGKTEWNELLSQISHYLKVASWSIQLRLQQNVIHYYLCTSRPMPASLNLIDFLLKPCTVDALPTSVAQGLYYNKWNDNFVTIFQDLYKRQYQLAFAELTFRSFSRLSCRRIKICYRRGTQLHVRKLLLTAPSVFLSINFEQSKTFLFKKFPKYLKLEKVTQLLSSNSDQALLEIDPFPYLETAQYLTLDRYDFTKHSLVIGSSGSGKSRFLASLIHKLSLLSPQAYKVVVIDPHDAFYRDCAGLNPKVTNFQTIENGLDLFASSADDLNASVELTLTLFRSLMNDNYNGHLERVLRYATYLLTTARAFSFITLRKLLLDLEYRNAIVQQYQNQIPASVAHFFLADFNELKTQNYKDAIAPIIAFIDEMQMVPVFNSESLSTSLAQTVTQNFLNIFSLNRLKLGDKVTKTIAGLLMQQLFLLAQQNLPAHLLIIIDEVAIVENPIIARFLSEMRKYHTSIILAGQYFDQITPELRAAIFANSTNYYLFRVSQSDAELLTKNLKIEIEGSDKPEDSQKLLTKLKARECLTQISAGDELLPIFKARTATYQPALQAITQPIVAQQTIVLPENSPISHAGSATLPTDQTTFPLPASTLEVDSDVDFNTIMQSYSTSRKLNHIKPKEPTP